jgi:beta-alanine--pyruvate transaminase
MDVFKEEGLFEQARANEKIFEEAIHSLKDLPNVIDIRNFGLMGAIELASSDQPGARGYTAHTECFREGVFIRSGMDTLQFSPFFDADEAYYSQVFDTVGKVISNL